MMKSSKVLKPTEKKIASIKEFKFKNDETKKLINQKYENNTRKNHSLYG